MWIPLGIGVAGFLSGIALAVSDSAGLCIHPFVAMLRPAAAMSARPDLRVVMYSLSETALFLLAGLWAARSRRCE